MLSIGSGAASRIYKTTDGGRSWKLSFQNEDPAAFFDCLAFRDARHGVAMYSSQKPSSGAAQLFLPDRPQHRSVFTYPTPYSR